MPETMIGYRALTAWVKRFESGLEFGIYSDDEIRDTQPVDVESVVIPDQVPPSCQACGNPSDPKFTTVLDGFVIHVCSAHCLGLRQAAYAQYLKQQQSAEATDEAVEAGTDEVYFDSGSDDDCFDPGPDADPEPNQTAAPDVLPPPPKSEPEPKTTAKNEPAPNPDKMSENQSVDWYEKQSDYCKGVFDEKYTEAKEAGEDNHSALRIAMKECVQ